MNAERMILDAIGKEAAGKRLTGEQLEQMTEVLSMYVTKPEAMQVAIRCLCRAMGVEVK